MPREDLSRERDPTRVRQKFGYLHQNKDHFYGIPDSTNNILDEGEITGIRKVNGIPAAEVHDMGSDGEDFEFVGGSHDALAEELTRYSEVLPEDALLNPATANIHATPIVKVPPANASSAIRKGDIQPEKIVHPSIPDVVGDRHNRNWFKVVHDDNKAYKNRALNAKIVPTNPPSDIPDFDEQQQAAPEQRQDTRVADTERGTQRQRKQRTGRTAEGELSSSSSSTSTSEDERIDTEIVHKPRKNGSVSSTPQQRRGEQQRAAPHPFQPPHPSFAPETQHDQRPQQQQQQQQQQQRDTDRQRTSPQRQDQQPQQRPPRDQQQRDTAAPRDESQQIHITRADRERAPGLFGGNWWQDAAGLNFYQEKALLDEFHHMEQAMLRGEMPPRQRQQQRPSIFSEARIPTQQKHAALSAYSRLRAEHGEEEALRHMAKQYERGYRKSGGVEGAISSVTGDIERAPRPQGEDEPWEDDLHVRDERRIANKFLALERAMSGFHERKTGAPAHRQGLFEGRQVPHAAQKQAVETFERLRERKGEEKALKKLHKRFEKGYREGGIESAISGISDTPLERAQRPSAALDEWEDDLHVREEKRIARAFLALEHAMEPHVRAQVEQRRARGKRAADVEHLTGAGAGREERRPEQRQQRQQRPGQQGRQQRGQQQQQQRRRQPSADRTESTTEDEWSDVPVRRPQQPQQQQRRQNAPQAQDWEDVPVVRRGRVNPDIDYRVHPFAPPPPPQFGGFGPFIDPRFHNRRRDQWFNDRDAYPYGRFW